MHPLSLFPTLFSWQLLAPTLDRLVLGVVLLHWAYREMRNTEASIHAKGLCLIEGLAGLFLLAGYFTQAAALIIAIDLVIRIIGRVQRKAFLTDGVNYYLILLVLAVSLLVTGPGFFALDFPL